MKQIYLDWAATAIPESRLLETAFTESLETFGNPSSPHKRGKEASALLQKSREDCAAAFGCSAEKLYFTGGGTESNNIVISSFLRKPRKGNIVISGIEHSAVYEAAMILQDYGWEIRIVNTDKDGRIDPAKFCGKIDNDSLFASCMMVNNETGAVQPVIEIGEAVKAVNRRTHFHVDAVQAAGKIDFNLSKMPIDSASISSHKFRGPRGAGLLYLKKAIMPVYAGGGQETGIRSGTENVYAALGTSLTALKAVESIDANLKHALKLKKILIERLSEISGIRFLPDCGTEKLLNPVLFSPYILSVSVKPVPGEILVRVMSDRGFDIATGSACATGRKKRSRIMEAMGISSAEAFSTVRISTGASTEVEEIEQFCDTFVLESAKLIKQLKR